MSNQDDYLAKLDVIKAIADEETKSPTMPVDVYLQEAENLYHWCQDDEAQLTGAGLAWNLVQEIPIRAGALREGQSLWFKERFTREEAEKDWNEQSPEGYDLRNQLLHSLHYAYRNAADLAGRVSAIADGSGHADMIQDLNDIAVLGKENIEPLQKINFDLALLDEAATTADALSDLLAQATTDREENNSARVIRDQAFTYLKQAVDEVRNCGQYVFWRNEERLKGYGSQHFRKARAASRASAVKSSSGDE